MLTKSITNLLFFKRTKEFEKNDSLLKHKKKGIEYKPLKKFEDDKPYTDPITVPIHPVDKSVNEKRKNQSDEEQMTLKKFVKTCSPFIEGGNTHSGKQNDLNHELLAELKKDNERLMKINEKLYGLCFLKDKH